MYMIIIIIAHKGLKEQFNSVEDDIYTIRKARMRPMMMMWSLMSSDVWVTH